MKNVKFLFLILLSVVSFSSAAVAMGEKVDKTEKNNIVQDGFGQQDMFRQMEEMQKNVDKVFADQKRIMAQMMEESKKNTAAARVSSNNSAIKTTENDKSYIYELTFSSFKKEDVMIGVKDRVLTMSAKADQVQDEDSKKEKIGSSTSFYYSVLLPKDADLEPHITREDKKITVVFAKKKPATDKKPEKKK